MRPVLAAGVIITGGLVLGWAAALTVVHVILTPARAVMRAMIGA